MKQLLIMLGGLCVLAGCSSVDWDNLTSLQSSDRSQAEPVQVELKSQTQMLTQMLLH